MMREVFLAGGLMVAFGYASLRGQTTDTSTVALEPMRVSASRIAAADVEGPQVVERYDHAQIESTGAFTVEEFLTTLPTAEQGTQPLVLVDGRPTFLDPASIPMGLIEGIDVSEDGSMPGIGVYHTGRIINIRLKKDYVGGETGGKYTGTFAGGGNTLTFRASTTANLGKWRTLISLEYQRNASLSALDRPYAREQDHRARGGQDLRLAWGYPAVIEAVDGTLDVLDSRVALVPEGTRATPSATEFLAGDAAFGGGPADQRRFNTAPFRLLRSPSERASLNLNLTYRWSERLQASFSASHSRTESERSGPPPLTRASADTLVPAAFNPFGEDVRVGFVHLGFGPTLQNSNSARTDAGFQMNGRIGEEWRWDARAGYRENDSRQRTAELVPERFTAALRDPEPARRFNPFIDERAGAVHTALYPTLTDERLSLTERQSTEADLEVEGPLRKLPGGPLAFNAKAELGHSERTRVSNRVAGGELTHNRVGSSSHEISASLNVPFFSSENARPALRRLEFQLAGEQQGSSDDGGETSTQVGLVWSPFKSVLLRARRAMEVERPSHQILAGTDRIIGASLIDPRRGGETIPEVQAITRALVSAEDEESERSSFGVTVEPDFLRGLRLSATYRVREQHAMFQDDFEVQDVLNNETALGDRVVRAARTAEDEALGLPGRVTAVDVTPGNTGEAERHDLHFTLEYRLPERGFGRLRLTASAERHLRSRYEILPGIPFVEVEGGRFRRARWSGQGLIAWSHDGWQASVRVRHDGAIPAAQGADALEAYTVADLNAGYRFRLKGHSADRQRSRQLKLNASIGNAFDIDPPWADTVNGYRNGSPLGRTYSLAATLEF